MDNELKERSPFLYDYWYEEKDRLKEVYCEKCGMSLRWRECEHCGNKLDEW
jgi:predicted RNA-binding protein with PUA domain